jgi:hypothetical protein
MTYIEAAMQRWHAQRAREWPVGTRLQRFHAGQARILRERFKRERNQPWNWQQFIKAYNQR